MIVKDLTAFPFVDPKLKMLDSCFVALCFLHGSARTDNPTGFKLLFLLFHHRRVVHFLHRQYLPYSIVDYTYKTIVRTYV